MDLTITGGLRFKDSDFVWKNATWPFANLTVSKEGVEILVDVWSVYRRKITLRKDEIIKVKKRIGILFCCGTEIIHTSEAAPKFLCFWKFGYAYERYAQAFEALGYSVDRKGKLIL